MILPIACGAGYGCDDEFTIDRKRKRKKARSDVNLVTIAQLFAEQRCRIVVMTAEQKRVLALRCPTCGAKPGEKCELSTGQPRTDPHRDRRFASAEK